MIADECSAIMDSVETLSHELHVYRGDKRVWLGPIIKIVDGAKLQIVAADLMWWPTVRFLHRDHYNVGTPLPSGAVFESVLADAMSSDNSSGMTVVINENGETAELDVRASTIPAAWDALHQLSESTVDWTVVGRTVYIGPKPGQAQIPLITNQSFLDTPEITFSVEDWANSFTVAGDGLIRATSTNTDSVARYGLVERRVEQPTLKANADAQRSADSYVARSGMPMAAAVGELAPTFEIGIDDMIPGAVMNTLVEGRSKRITGPHRLLSFTERVDKSGARAEIKWEPVGLGA